MYSSFFNHAPKYSDWDFQTQQGQTHYPECGSWMCPYRKKEALETSQPQTLPQHRYPSKSRASGSYTSMFLQHHHPPFAYLVLPLNQFVSSGIAMSTIPHNSDSCLGSNIFSLKLQMCLLLFGVWKMRAEKRHEEMRRGHVKILSVFLSRLNSGALPLERPNAPLLPTAVHTTWPCLMV